MSAIDKAMVAWGGQVPSWIRALAEECDQGSQQAASRRLGRSASLISAVLANKYKGDLEAVEILVRGRLMASTVECPVVGALAKDVCLANQKAVGATHNPGLLIFRDACRTCVNARQGDKS